ncbi:MAG: heme exporter protein CcmD [Alphaproteobacteria bacterium]|nr:heme exporter protein CcmD [Alphaproteobacteria bacterium]
MAEYFAMGGFAWFIWPAYFVTLGFMIGITVSTLRGLKADRRTLAELEKDAPHRQRRKAAADRNAAQADAPQGVARDA